MSVEVAFRKVAVEITSGQSIALSEEFSLTTAELSYLQDRKVAYENLAKRTGLEGVKSVCLALMQSERYGTPLGQSLRVMAQENRDMRMNEAEKKAAALPPREADRADDPVLPALPVHRHSRTDLHQGPDDAVRRSTRDRAPRRLAVAGATGLQLRPNVEGAFARAFSASPQPLLVLAIVAQLFGVTKPGGSRQGIEGSRSNLAGSLSADIPSLAMLRFWVLRIVATTSLRLSERSRQIHAPPPTGRSAATHFTLIARLPAVAGTPQDRSNHGRPSKSLSCPSLLSGGYHSRDDQAFRRCGTRGMQSAVGFSARYEILQRVADHLF